MKQTSNSSSSSSSSMLELLPLPIIYSNYYYCHNNNNKNQQQQHTTTKLSMATSSKILPPGALDYESKVLKRVNYIQETFQTTKTMDALFGGGSDDPMKKKTDENNSLSSSSKSIGQELVDTNSLVIRVLYCGGFTDGSFENNGKYLPSSPSSLNASKHHSRLQNLAGNSSSASSKDHHHHDTKNASSSSSSSKPPSTNIFDTIAFASENTNTSTKAKTSYCYTSTPGLAFVGKVVAAGKNVHFSNEWVPDPEPTSILPRGFKEGDLVCGLQCDKSWLRGEPLRGSAASYLVVPACFVMRIPSSIIVLQSSSSSSSSPSSSSLLSSLAGNLLSSVLWYNLLKWHVDPKKDESILFVSVHQNNKNNKNKVSLAASSCSSLIPAVGAVLCAAMRFFDNTRKNENGNDVFAENTNQIPIGVVSTCEDDSKLLRKFEEYVRTNSSLFNEVHEKDNDNTVSSPQVPLFEIVEVFSEESKRKKIKKYHHVVISYDGYYESNEEEEDDEEEEEEEEDPQTVEKLLFRVLAENGTIGHITNQVVSTQNHNDFVSSTLLPLAMTKHGRLAFMSTKSLFDSPIERIRRSLTEITSLLLSKELSIPPPTRVIKPDQQKFLDPIIKQYKSFLSLRCNSNQKDDENNSSGTESINFYTKQMEWYNFADRVGTVVNDMLNKSLGGLTSMMTNRKRQKQDENSVLMIATEQEEQQQRNNDCDGGDENENEEAAQTRHHHHGSLYLLSRAETAAQSSDVSFENGLNSLVIQFPGGV